MAILTFDQVAAVAVKAGFPPGPAVIAVAVTTPESGRDATIVQQGQPYATTGWGLWQITPGNSEPQFGIDQQLLHPMNNARAAHAKWAGAGGFTPWTTFTSGKYLPYMDASLAAVSYVTHLTLAQLDRLARQAGAAAGQDVTGAVAAEDWSPEVRALARRHTATAAHLVRASHAIAGLRPAFTEPVVTVPSPAALLWKPGEELPR